MTTPLPLLDFIAGARNSIEQAHSIDIGMRVGNVETYLRSAQSNIEPTAKIDRAFDLAIQGALEFRKEVTEQQSLSRQDKPAIENARQIALMRIDELEDSLTNSRPSADAVAIGLDWF